jgi:hypothetical protein
MAISNLVQLKTTTKNKPATTTRRSVCAKRAMRRQAATAAAIGTVAVVLTALSLSHLAHGISLVTGAAGWESWAMAVGIDLGFVALELSLITVGDKLLKTVARYARPAIVGTLIGSAGMNAFAFAAAASGPVTMAAAVVLGIAIPALIYALTRVGAAIYIDCDTRA